MKTCPECGQQWGVKFRFCPVDGTALPEIVATTPAPPPTETPRVIVEKPKANQRLVNVEPVTSMPTNPAQPAVKDRPFALPEPQQKTRRTGRSAGSNDRTRAFGSVTEAPKSDGEAPWEVEHRATSKADSLMRVAPTVLVDALTPEQIAADRKARGDGRKGKKSGPMTAAKAASEAVTAPLSEKAVSAAKRRGGDFSETAWFASARPDEADPVTGTVEVDQARYAQDKVAPEKRKRFSLRRDGED